MKALGIIRKSACIVAGTMVLLCQVAVAQANGASGQGPGGSNTAVKPVGTSPSEQDPIQFSLDEDNFGAISGITPVDADDLSKVGIDGMAYIYQTFKPVEAAGLAPSRPAGYHNAVANPFDLGLRRNTLQVGAPLQTHKDEVNALSYGQDAFFLNGTLTGNPDPSGTPFLLRDSFSLAGEPKVVGGTRVGIEFSVDVHALGIAGTGVASAVGNPHKPSSHVFSSFVPLTNSILYEPNPVAAPDALAIFDKDDVDAYENVPDRLNALQDPQDRALGTAQSSSLFFSVDNETVGYDPVLTGVPNAVSTQATLKEAAGDIFIAIGGGNLLLIDEGQLGLWPGGVGDPDGADDLDALALNILINPADLAQRIQLAIADFQQDLQNPNNGFGITIPLLNDNEAAVLFSVEEGSIGLFGSAVDFEHRLDPSEESGDLFFSNLTGQNWLSFEATSLGLLESDELDALDTTADIPPIIPEPATLMLLAAAGCLASARPRRRRSI